MDLMGATGATRGEIMERVVTTKPSALDMNLRNKKIESYMIFSPRVSSVIESK